MDPHHLHNFCPISSFFHFVVASFASNFGSERKAKKRDWLYMGSGVRPSQRSSRGQRSDFQVA